MLTSVASYLFLYDIYKITRETYCYFLENFKIIQGLGWLNELPIRRGFVPGWCIRLAAASDKVYQLLTHGRWFSPGTPASSTTKTGRHDIAEILLKVALKHQKSNQSIISTNNTY